MTSAPDRVVERPAAQEGPTGWRSSRRAATAFRLGFAVLLMTPWAIGLGATAVNENRTPTPFPSLAPAEGLDTSTYRQIDAALKDRLSLKPVVVRAVSEVSEKAGVSLSERVVRGSAGVLFSSEEFTRPCGLTLDTAWIDATLTRWQGMAQGKGGDVVFAIAPDKSVIERASLGERAEDLMVCSDDVRAQIQAYSAQRSDSPLLTIWDEAARASAIAPGRTYQRGDTHWTSLGALTMSRALVVRAGADDPQRWARLFDAGVVVRPDRERPGDLYQQLGQDKADLVPTITSSRPGVAVTIDQRPGTTYRGVKVIQAAGTAQRPVIPGRTLVIHDSYYDAADAQLRPYFAKAHVMHWSDLEPEIAAGRLPAVDRIVMLTVQRYVGDRIGILQDPEVAAGIEQALAP